MCSIALGEDRLIVVPLTIEILGFFTDGVFIADHFRLARTVPFGIPLQHIFVTLGQPQLIKRRNSDEDISVTLIGLICNSSCILNLTTGWVRHIKLQDVVITINWLTISWRTSITSRATVMPLVTRVPAAVRPIFSTT